MAEQRYQAVLQVIAEGRTVTEVASQWGVTRQTMHAWLAKYEAGGLEALGDRSHRTKSCPHQMNAVTETAVLEMRRTHQAWGPRRIRYELARRKVTPLPTESAIYRCLKRAGVIDPNARKRRNEHLKRWERGSAMELWQMDVVGGFLLNDGSTAKALTGVDDHSRFCVSARLMARERTRHICDGLQEALARHGLPQQILTDNGKVFTGRLFTPPVEVMFDKICRENGIEHILTRPYSPTTTGKIERFHRSLRAEFDTRRSFTNMKVAQQALDEWVEFYNTQRPHQSLDMATPGERFQPGPQTPTNPITAPAAAPERSGDQWVARKITSNGVVSVDWQQICVGASWSSTPCDAYVDDKIIQIWVGDKLLKTVLRKRSGPVRKNKASIPSRKPVLTTKE